MATPVDYQFVVAIVTVAASAGAAWAGVRAGLNGMRENVKEIRSTLQTHAAALTAHVQADHLVQVEAVKVSSSIETKVDALIDERHTLHKKLDELLRRD